MKKVLLIVNTGTPDAPEIKPVRKYLSEFLNDPRVIDLPWLARKILVNVIIVPFRAPHSVMLYKRLWKQDGSPLKINLNKLSARLQKKLQNEYTVVGAMRYGKPSLRSALTMMDLMEADEITVLPLYPQYTFSTTESVKDVIRREIKSWKSRPAIRFIEQFYSHPGFIEAFAGRIAMYDPSEYDHLLFSYHSLPVRHINAVHPGTDYKQCTCNISMPEYGKMCYRAACYETSRLIAARLDLPDQGYSTSFQSRMSSDWLGPFTDQVLKELSAAGKKKILVAAPSFVADCLETVVEIGEDYANMFRENGGEDLMMVESLNSDYLWVNAIAEIIKDENVQQSRLSFD
jgi:ferrochelatase